MRIFPIISAFCLIAIIALGTAQAQETTVRKSDVVRLLGELPNLSPIREDMEALGFRGEKLEMAVDQITRMLRDPVIANNIADRVIAARDPSVQSVESGGLFWPLVDRGLGHLTARDIRYFYLVEQTMLKALPHRLCGLTVKERLPAERLAKATGSIAARLNTPALREYYRIQFRAAQLGATRDVARLSMRDEARIIVKINEALGRTLADRDDAKALMRAYEDLRRVSNRRACIAGRVFMDAVLSMEGRDLHHALILLSTP
ncbi:hypothetical protein [uncultured Roseovarius sp.]|uniref:hypothetical protein n=1 Tax=uncultured Roseovarius sp. TaxID=293344 RepID=UPI002615BB3F|nr:hypothetical protein [uncultured Roseovarius sp.]